MQKTSMREELIFIKNIIQSGCAFGLCQSDGAGVFIPPAIFKKYGSGQGVGDCMMARMVVNANDVRGELPYLALMLTVPFGALNGETGQPEVAAPNIQLDRILEILLDDEYNDRWFSVEDMLVELSLPDTVSNVKIVKEEMNALCNKGVCAHVTSRVGSSVRSWYTADVIKPE